MTPSLPLRDRIIPWYFVLFFGVIATVNGVMVWLAIGSNSGLVTEHPYEKGLAYNEVVRAEAAQQALGWSGNIAYTDGLLRFTLQDNQHALIVPDKVTASFTRPTRQGDDFTLTLQPEAKGSWSTKVTFPEAGLWEARIYAVKGDDRFQQAKRVIAP